MIEFILYYAAGSAVTFFLTLLYLVLREEKMFHDDARLMIFGIFVWPIFIGFILYHIVVEAALYGVRFIRHRIGKDI